MHTTNFPVWQEHQKDNESEGAHPGDVVFTTYWIYWVGLKIERIDIHFLRSYKAQYIILHYTLLYTYPCINHDNFVVMQDLLLNKSFGQ